MDLIPQPSILEKLNTLDPTASEQVFDLLEKIQIARCAIEKTIREDHRAQERAIAEERCAQEWATFSRQPLKAFLHGIAMIGNGLVLMGSFGSLAPLRRQSSISIKAKPIEQATPSLSLEEEAMQRNWIDVGDGIRLAIQIYMKDKNLTGESIKLTDLEKQDLEPILLSSDMAQKITQNLKLQEQNSKGLQL